MKWPVLLIGVVLVAAVFIFALSYGSPGVPTETATSTATTTEIIPGTLSVPYINSELGFTIMRPDTTEIQTSGFEGFLPVTARSVAAFILPANLYKGTNLVDAGLYIGASADTKIVNACLSATGDNEKTLGNTKINGTTYSVFTSTGVGAGNIYEETVYRTIRAGTCLELVELLHSGNIGNYPSGQVKEFGHDAFKALLEAMLNTLSFTGTPASGVEGMVNTTCLTDSTDPSCVPQVRTVEAYQGISSVALFKTAENGAFRSVLPPGQYELRVDAASSTHCISVGVLVTDASFVSTNISCEAGMQ